MSNIKTKLLPRLSRRNRFASSLSLGVSLALGSSASFAAATDYSGFVENATYIRDGVGLSKFRNTAQLEFIKPIETSGSWYNVTLNGVLRATYNGVYDLNDDEFGKDARHAYLGENWHPNNTVSSNVLLTSGVPLPCENDPLLCNNLEGYMDHDEDDVRFSDFNDELDFIREFYIDATTDIGNEQLSVRVGKQQVVWGRTDLFRVLDVINPVDYSRHNIYDELEDIRIPQWIAQAELRMGATGVFDDMNLALVWNFDKFRPNNLGTCGQAYRILDAGCFFSSYINTPGGPVPIIHDVKIPNWKPSNTQGGFKWEGVYGDATFSVNALTYRQQLPSLHFRPHATVPNAPAADGVFDIHFPRVNLLGGALDYYSMDLDSTLRVELAYTEGEELPADIGGHNETDMVRYVLGIDKNIILPALSTSAFLVSAQLFGEHIAEHRADMPNKEDNWTATLLFKGFWMNNRLSPQIIIAHDVAAKATAFAPSIEYIVDDHWKVNFGANIKTGGKETFPWSVAAGALGDSSGQYEPLARFLNGPIGVANQEDELQLSVRYSF